MKNYVHDSLRDERHVHIQCALDTAWGKYMSIFNIITIGLASIPHSFLIPYRFMIMFFYAAL